MNEDRITGQRAGIRWAIAWLRGYADNSDGSFLRNVLRMAASDMLAAAKAMRTDELPSDGWQDIATAPRDGTWILVYEPGEYAPMVHVVQWGLTEWGRDGPTWVTIALGPNPDTHNAEGATHWMPLPPPPDTTDDITKED